MKKVALTKLHKLEVPRFVDEVIEIIEKYDPIAMNIQLTYDLLVGF